MVRYVAALSVTMALLLFTAAGATAGPRHPGHDVIFSQEPTTDEFYMGYSSSQLPDQAFFSESAADFVVEETCEIVHLHWWGTGLYFPKTAGPPPMSLQRVDWSGEPLGRQVVCAGRPSIGCATSISDSTYGSPTNVDSYSGSPWNESGPERVYRLVVPADGAAVTISITPHVGDLDVFLLDECDENTCIDYGDSEIVEELNAGYYYVVVDGYMGASGTFDLDVTCAGIPSVFFAVRFYEDIYVPSRDAHMPGDRLYEVWVDDFHQAFVDTMVYSYWADIPPFPVSERARYWLSIQAYNSSFDHGIWYWIQHSPLELEHPYMDYPSVAPRWTSFPDAGLDVDDDLAFELSKYDSPVERTSWGTIKALYRK